MARVCGVGDVWKTMSKLGIYLGIAVVIDRIMKGWCFNWSMEGVLDIKRSFTFSWTLSFKLLFI